MGSLMSGWDSPVSDPKSGKYRKSWSFTKEEIESYWKLKKKIEEEHLKAISTPSDGTKGGQEKDDGAKLQRSSSVPAAESKTGFMDKETKASLQQIMKKSDWWTSSSWAFLNEPPVLDRPSSTYTSQFHIASISNSKADREIAT